MEYLSPSSIGLKTLDKKTARGIAAIVTITPVATVEASGKVTFIKLR